MKSTSAAYWVSILPYSRAQSPRWSHAKWRPAERCLLLLFWLFQPQNCALWLRKLVSTITPKSAPQYRKGAVRTCWSDRRRNDWSRPCGPCRHHHEQRSSQRKNKSQERAKKEAAYSSTLLNLVAASTVMESGPSEPLHTELLTSIATFWDIWPQGQLTSCNQICEVLAFSFLSRVMTHRCCLAIISGVQLQRSDFTMAPSNCYCCLHCLR